MEKPKGIFLTEEEKLEYKRSMTYTDRFRILMGLIQISKMLKNAKITYPDPNK